MSPVAPPPRDGNAPLRAPVTALAESAQLTTLQAVLGQSPIGAGIFDSECRYVMINDALQRIIGLPAHQLIGRRVDDVLGSLGAVVARNLRDAMNSGSPLVNVQFEGATFAHNGAIRTYLASYFRLADDAGKLIGAASLVTDLTEQQLANAELTRANERLALLSRVSGALASCLDVHDALTAFADLVVPAFADHCVIDLIDDDEQQLVRRVALVHAEGLAPDQEAWATPGQQVRYPTHHPAMHAMRTRQAVVEHADADPDFEHIAPTPESAMYGRRVGIRSAMTAPLVARGEVLGAVSFVTSASGRKFDEGDVEMGEELASRIATALDNSRLYAREQRIALTLQRSLLPERLPATPSLEKAAVYQPAAHDGNVGGDWYDVVPLPCGRVGLVIGDVMGRGVRAAALMGQLRAAVRAYATQDLPPAELLGHLDGLVHGLADDTLVTCLYAVYDPVEEALCVANAGHLPPLLVTADDARRLDVGGVVLGAGHGSYEQTEVAFPADAMLALYTDGLVERRNTDIDGRIEDLGALLRHTPGALADICASVVRTLDDELRDPDDLALMLVRPRPQQRPKVARYAVVPHAAKVRDIRRFASETLATWGEPAGVVEQVQLIVSELVTNVIRHASGHEAVVRLERHVDRVVVAVVDRDDAPPRVGGGGRGLMGGGGWGRVGGGVEGDDAPPGPCRPSLDAESGRGLHLVEAVCDRWGSRLLPDGGKIVWCELAVAADD